MPAAPWYTSKTIWMNIIMGVCTALVPALPFAGQAGAWITANGAIIGTVWMGLGILLRLVTKDAIKLGE